MPQRRLPKRSILDAGDLPVGEIAHIARREGIRPRAAYQAHKWFARRLAATARSLLVAATAPEGTDFWTAYYGGGSCEGLTVLDPFMGGGVMLLEAARLGADVLGVDVEPVAAVVSDFQGRLPQLPTLSPDMERLRASAGAELAPFYRAVDAEGREERLLHAFWVQVLACAACQTRFDAHPSFRLAWDDARQREWVVCACCSRVSERTVSREGFVCTGCGTATDPADGHLDHGTAVCPVCRHRQRLIDLAARTSRPPEFRLFAVETIPTGPERRHTGASRRIRTASDNDQRAYADAQGPRIKPVYPYSRPAVCTKVSSFAGLSRASGEPHISELTQSIGPQTLMREPCSAPIRRRGRPPFELPAQRAQPARLRHPS